jgi:hypothetical protein
MKNSLLSFFLIVLLVPLLAAHATSTTITTNSSPTGQNLTSYNNTTGTMSFQSLPFVSSYSYGVKCDGVTDDTASIQAAINAKAATLPYGDCIITHSLYIGNGTKSTQSTIHDITLVGQGWESGPQMPDQGNSGGTRLVWNGPSGGTMISIRGPINDVTISKITLDGKGKAGYGIFATHMSQSQFNQVRVDHFTKTAFVFTANATRQITGVDYGDCSNVFTQLATDAPANKIANGILLDGSSLTGFDSCRNQFYESEIGYGGSTGSCGVTLAFADNNIFIGGMLYPAIENMGGYGVCLKNAYTYFPQANDFIGTAIIQGVGGTSGTGGNLFGPYPTADGEPIPFLPYVHYWLYDGTSR